MNAQTSATSRQNPFHALKIVGEALMLLVCVFMLLPFYYILNSSFKTNAEVANNALALPKWLYLDNYVNAFHTMQLFHSFFNTLLITVSTAVIVIVFGSMAAYSINRRKHKIYKAIMLYFLLGFMVPVQTTMVPLFILMQHLNLINKLYGVIILTSGSSTFSFFLYQGFMSTVPSEMDESAYIDGASVFRTFWQIIFPLLKPITVTMAIFHVMGTWNDFLTPFLFLSSRVNSTLMLEMYRCVGEFVSDWSTMMSAMVFVVSPLVIFYVLAQRYIIEGLTSGALKG
jgi:raffinose/stachyose/melibiose transport system permease protein